MADYKPKFKFKKPKGGMKKKQLRRDSDEDAHDVQKADTISSGNDVSTNNDENEEPSALDKIKEVERRRKLFSTRNRGVDAANLGKQVLRQKAVDSDEDDDEAVVKNKDLEERLKGTFSEGKLAGSNDMGGDIEGGIIAKKHKRAMEDFIKSNLQAENNGGDTAHAHVGEVGEKFKSSADMEKELYSELLVSDSGSKNEKIAQKDEGDVGAGGAMMGGTGIAEVTLPIDDRIKAIKDTEKAAMEYERARKVRHGLVDDLETTNSSSIVNDTRQSESMDSSILATMVLMNFASGPGKRKRKDIAIPEASLTSPQQQPVNTFDPSKDFQFPVHSSAIPSGSFIERNEDASNLGGSYSHNFAQHNREWIEQKKDERQAEIDAIVAQNVEDGPEESKARIGFEVARKLVKGEVFDSTNSGKGGELKNEWNRKHGSSDDRVWKTFMSSEKNRR